MTCLIIPVFIGVSAIFDFLFAAIYARTDSFSIILEICISRVKEYILQNAIRHKMLQFIPEMGWIATFLCLCGVKLTKHLEI